MITFEAFISRHGEGSVQAMLENFERFNQITDHGAVLPLEQRWNRFMSYDVAEDTRMAA
ncbi:MAG: hypothetical protein JO126_02645 [Alphaproteobacteria bacterium]|nr:hypothetical protein [Alphaproteobacteria bacterium]MBV8548339.1 hypothetical protein [Alphaproteobacteria bacterium]